MKTNCETSNSSKPSAFHSDQEIANSIIQKGTKKSKRNSILALEKSDSLADAWQYGLHEEYWTHGITISLGNGLNVSENQAKRRLKYIALRLKRKIWGHHRDENQRKILFMVFKHQLINRHKRKEEKETGSRNWSLPKQNKLVQTRYNDLKWSKSKKPSKGEHYHALMAVKGNHGWSDQAITDAIIEIENNRKKEDRWEKAARVDFDWRKGNRFHGYLAREILNDELDNYFFMRV